MTGLPSVLADETLLHLSATYSRKFDGNIMIDVLAIPGTGEAPSFDGRPVGMTKAVTDLLPSSEYDSYYLDYPRSYGPVPIPHGMDYESSIDRGVAMAVEWIRSRKNPVGVVAYSQGCAVISEILEHIELGGYEDLEIAFVGLIANPTREGGDSLDPNAVGYGIMGQHLPWPDSIPTYELANPKDPICCLPASSPLRSFYDLTKTFSFTNPGRWGASLIGAARKAQQDAGKAWWNITAPDRWGQAVREALAYVVWGEHTMYSNPARHFPGTEHSYCAELAEAITADVAAFR